MKTTTSFHLVLLGNKPLIAQRSVPFGQFEAPFSPLGGEKAQHIKSAPAQIESVLIYRTPVGQGAVDRNEFTMINVPIK